MLAAACVKTVNSDRRIILVGNDGSGKSTAGNIILRKEVFNTSAVKGCQCEESKDENGGSVSVVNTPGLGQDLDKKMIECVVIHSFPGPHAFLLVINVKERSTLEENAAVKWIEDNFGSDASSYTILLFTHTDQLKSLDEYISESEHLRRLRNKFKGRYHAFNNQLKDRSQVSELLCKIEKMVRDNGRSPYTNDLYEETRKILHRNLDLLKKLASSDKMGWKEKEKMDKEIEKMKMTLNQMGAKIDNEMMMHIVEGLIGVYFTSFMAVASQVMGFLRWFV